MANGGEHGTPHASALLIIDMINDFSFPEADRLLIHFRRIAPVIARLRADAEAAGVPVIYVNDNYDQWQSDVGRLVQHCLDASGEPASAWSSCTTRASRPTSVTTTCCAR